MADDEKPWATYNRGKPLSPRQLARQLAGYGIKSKTVRLGPANTPKGFDAGQFIDAFARYLASPTKMPQQRNESPGSINGEAGSVADETQQSGNGVAGGVADNPQHNFIRNAAATREAMPELRRGDVADEASILGGETNSRPEAISVAAGAISPPSAGPGPKPVANTMPESQEFTSLDQGTDGPDT